MGSKDKVIRLESFVQVLLSAERLNSAKWMLTNLSCSAKKFAEGTHLNAQTISELAEELGVILPDTRVPS